MRRNLEVGDKVKVLSFFGKTYEGKVIKIGRSIIHVEVQFVRPTTIKFNKTTFLGLDEYKLWELDEVMFGEHEKYE